MIVRLVFILVTLLGSHYANADIYQDADNYMQSETMTYIPIMMDGITIIIPYGTGYPTSNTAFVDTVAGVDSDNDGIRDDVERKISAMYPENARARAFSYIFSKTMQEMIEQPFNKNLQLQKLRELYEVKDCLGRSVVNNADIARKIVIPMVLNTRKRSLAYIDAMGSTSGEILTAGNKCAL